MEILLIKMGTGNKLNDLVIKPMQQFAYTTGKNATDGFMIIDAMDFTLYTNRLMAFWYLRLQ